MFSSNGHVHMVPLPVTQPVLPLVSETCQLSIRQQPKEALVTTEGKEKARKPVDPPPILELKVSTDNNQQFLQSPYLLVSVSLRKPDTDEPADARGEKALAGTLVSSLHRLKDGTNKDGGYFVFGDISVKVAGAFRLHFSLFEFQPDTGMNYLGSVNSDIFNVQLPKDFKGMEESTYLSRAFSDQGVRLRLRKEPRGMMANKRAYPYGSEQADTPIRPNLQGEYSSSYEAGASPSKRHKPDTDERKDSFPTEASGTSAPQYPAYASDQAFSATSYPAARQPSFGPVTGYHSVGWTAGYENTQTDVTSIYGYRNSVPKPSNQYSNSAVQSPATNGVHPHTLSHQIVYQDMHSMANYGQLAPQPFEQQTKHHSR